MTVAVHIQPGPLPAVAPASAYGEAGAVVTFEGRVRPLEDGCPIAGLDYEAYQPMAQRLLQQLGEALVAEHGLLGLDVEHGVGRVGVGECSFRLRIAAVHRREALLAMEQFIDRMKHDVPIWKQPVLR